jgi:MFS family permease
MHRLKTFFKTDDFMVFLSTMFLIGIAGGLYAGVLNNFLAEILGIGRSGRGVVEFFRELPGFGLMLLLALLYRYSETRLIRVALFISLCGLAGLFLTEPNRVLAVVFMMLWSTGEHLLMPAGQSIAIHSAHEGKEGRAMGITGTFGSIGAVTGYYLVPLVFALARRLRPSTGGTPSAAPFKAVFLVSALFLVFAILCAARFHKSTHHVERERLYVRRKYLRYYVLEMFFGARKQIFLTFAPFVLILNYGAKTEYIAALYGINSLMNIFLNPLMGKLIDKVGYKTVLICDTVFLIAICFLYGFSQRLFSKNTAFLVISIVFVLDGMLFVVGMARSLYARSISTGRSELTSTLSTGISINHLISIIIALLGGLLWERMGIELLFTCAACFGLGAFVFSCSLPRPPGRVVKP